MESTVCSIRYLFVIALEIACIRGSSVKLTLGFTDLSPVEVIVQKNHPLLLNCSGYSEAGPLTIRWRHQGNWVNEDDHRQVLANGSLFIDKVIYQKKGMKYDGNYTCLLENNIGVIVSHPIRVILARISRLFTQEPQPLTIFEGDYARFSCQIHSIPLAVITWFHNGRQIPYNHTRFINLPSGVLQIANVSASDVGNYHCLCTNIAKQRVSIPAHLTVLPHMKAFQSPIFLSKPEPVCAVVNSSAVLECLVNGFSDIEVTWEREDGSAIEEERVTYSGKHNLHLLNVQPGDSGVYICIAKSVDPASGEVFLKSQKISLTVLVPPQFSSVPESHTKPPAQTSRFECVVEGNPFPEVEWLKNGDPLFINGRIKLKPGNVLVISQTVSTDSGVYQCVASNSIGIAIVAARLEITTSVDQPNPPEGLKAHTISSTSIQLSWDPAVSPSELAIQAYTVHYLPTAGGLELQSVAVNTSQLIAKLRPYTNYTFYVRAYNGRSASEQSETVTQMTGEDVPTSAPTVSLTSRSPTTLHVQWNELPQGKARGLTIKHRIHYRKHHQASYSVIDVPAIVREYTITGLQPKTKYDVRVMSGTKVGFPELIDDDWPWTVYQMPEAATTKVPMPPIMHLTVINTTTLEVEWSMPPENMHVVECFHLSYRQQSHPLKGPIIIPANITKFLLLNLVPHTWYEVHLVANNADGDSRESSRNIITVSGDNPEAEIVEVVEPPNQLEAEPTSSTTIHLIWKTPETSKNISYYTVRYHPVLANGLVNESLIHYIRSTNREVVITDLIPFTLYVFSVRSHDVHNRQGPFSQKVECKTMEDIPTPPQDVTWTRIDANSVRVNWHTPRHSNGIITAYHILYNIHVDDTDLNSWFFKVEGGTEISSLLNDLASNTVYYLCMKAENKAGLSPRTQILQMKLAMRQNSSRLPNQEVFDEQHDPLLGIIVGVAIGSSCVIICAIIIIYRNKCCPVTAHAPVTPNGHYSMYCTYGYMPQTNGHAGSNVSIRDKRLLRPVVQELDCFTPMLSHIPNGRTDHHLDTKGGYPKNTCNGDVKSRNGISCESQLSPIINVQASDPEETPVCKPRVRYRSAYSSSDQNTDVDSSTILLINNAVHDEHQLVSNIQTGCQSASYSARLHESSCNTKSSDSICSLGSTSKSYCTPPCRVPDPTIAAVAVAPTHRPPQLALPNSAIKKNEQNCVPSTPCLSSQENTTQDRENRTISSDEDDDEHDRTSLPYSVNAFLSPLITPRFSQTTSLHSSTELI